jgi:uncharacterized membrane protein
MGDRGECATEPPVRGDQHRGMNMPEDDKTAGPASAQAPTPGSSSGVQTSVLDEYLRPGRQNVMLIYVLYLAGIVPAFAGVPILIGFIIALLHRGQGGDPWVGHYEFQFRQAIILLGAWIVSFILVFVLIGFLLFLLVAIWWIIRTIKGLLAASRDEPIADPATFLW